MPGASSCCVQTVVFRWGDTEPIGFFQVVFKNRWYRSFPIATGGEHDRRR